MMWKIDPIAISLESPRYNTQCLQSFFVRLLDIRYLSRITPSKTDPSKISEIIMRASRR
jgi:hypothetical protein